MQAYLLNSRHLAGIVLLLGLIVAFVLMLTWYQSPTEQANKLRVGTTFYPLYAMAQAVGGDNVVVTNITPAGAEPHDYEPTPQQLVQLQNSDVLIYNGATFEPWIGGFLSGYHHLAVAASQGIDLLPSTQAATTTATDPHFWLDPVLAKQIVATIRDSFMQTDPANAANYQRRATAYLAELSKLDSHFRTGLASCRQHTVVTSHGALSYVSKQYGFSVESIAGVNPDDEPSPAKLAELSAVVKQQGITTILFETLVSPKLAQTVARETGATTAVFDPIEGLTEAEQHDGVTYLTVQQQNLQTLRKAMSCQ